jgi:hypothetical protein
MMIKKLAGALIGSMFALSSANAALITMDIAYGQTEAAAAEAAFLALARDSVTENFDGFGYDGSDSNGNTNSQHSWNQSAIFFDTSVGVFTVTRSAQSDSGEVNPENLMIESIATGEFGRDTSKLAGDFWLDSNDVEEMTWDLSKVHASFDSLGFYIVDANDNQARLVLRFDDGSTQDIVISRGLSDGNIAYITMISDVSISKASIVFDNDGDSAGPTNDGFSIDNVTVARVPEPTALALLGLGLLGFAAVRKRA